MEEKVRTMPRLTAFLIPGPDSDLDTAAKPSDRTMLIPFLLINSMMKETRATESKMYCFYHGYENKWVLTKEKKEIPKYISEDIILIIENGKIVSHKYYATI